MQMVEELPFWYLFFVRISFIDMNNICIPYNAYIHSIAMMTFSLVKIVWMFWYDNFCIRNNTNQH